MKKIFIILLTLQLVQQFLIEQNFYASETASYVSEADMCDIDYLLDQSDEHLGQALIPVQEAAYHSIEYTQVLKILLSSGAQFTYDQCKKMYVFVSHMASLLKNKVHHELS